MGEEKGKKYILGIKDMRKGGCKRKELAALLGNKRGLLNVAWLDTAYDGKAGGRYYADERDIRHEYPGQTWLYYPLRAYGHGFMLSDGTEGGTYIGYVVASKRAYRTEFAHLKYDKLDKLKAVIDRDVVEFVNGLNDCLPPYLYECTVYEVTSEDTCEEVKKAEVASGTNQLNGIMALAIEGMKPLEISDKLVGVQMEG